MTVKRDGRICVCVQTVSRWQLRKEERLVKLDGIGLKRKGDSMEAVMAHSAHLLLPCSSE